MFRNCKLTSSSLSIFNGGGLLLGGEGEGEGESGQEQPEDVCGGPHCYQACTTGKTKSISSYSGLLSQVKTNQSNK